MSLIAKVVLAACLCLLFLPSALIFSIAAFRYFRRWPIGRKGIAYVPPGEPGADMTAPVLYQGLALKKQKVAAK